MDNVVKASPTKEFFVNMMVRDILLKQAIIELIDNSIDGARNIRTDNDFSGLKIDVQFSDDTFVIQDNCGGIPLNVAANYAFRFGRPKDMQKGNTESTGIFGIGMKRALFKMGNVFSIHSISKTSEFQIDIDVAKWLEKEDTDWDFAFTSSKADTNNPEEKTGTVIEVKELYPDIKAELQKSTFEDELIEHIQRRVGLDIAHGLNIQVNSRILVGNNISLINNDEIKSFKEEYEDGEIKVNILAGIAPREGKDYPPEKAGWYIYCNGRLVVAADKTSLTTWKDMENKSSGIVFHNNYAGFRGIVYFSSVYPEKLPWNTTKTGLDETSQVYLKAKEIMFEAFKIVKTTIDDIRKNSEKEDDGIEETIAGMQGTEMTKENVDKIKENRTVNIKSVKVVTNPNVSIGYKKPKSDVEKVRKVLGVKTNKEVGERTFEYYIDAEC